MPDSCVPAEELEVDLGDMVILYISFKMGATVQGVYSSEEFVRGMTALGCVT